MEEAIISENEPKDFAMSAIAAAVFVEFEDKYLHLKRSKETFQGGTWCLPGGRIDGEEQHQEALLREVFEETRISFDLPKLNYIGLLYGRLLSQTPNLDYELHIYHYKAENMHVCTLSNEHSEYKWLPFKKVRELPLIAGHNAVIDYFICQVPSLF